MWRCVRETKVHRQRSLIKHALDHVSSLESRCGTSGAWWLQRIRRFTTPMGGLNSSACDCRAHIETSGVVERSAAQRANMGMCFICGEWDSFCCLMRMIIFFLFELVTHGDCPCL
jgi:hypothetical protein